MGNQCCADVVGQNGVVYRQINVMTLNYCGIAESPFQFYLNQYEHQLQAIGNIFYQICKDQFKEFLEIDNTSKLFGKIELKFKKGRYSPMFNKMVGIEEIQESFQEKYRFLNQSQFTKEWNKAFDIHRNNNAKFNKLCEQSGEQKLAYYKNNVKKYDFLMFKALLEYVYRNHSLQTCLKNGEDPLKYLKIIEPLFEFSFLDKANKLSKFQYGFRKTNPDVYFIQEICNQLIHFMEQRARRNYWWIADDDQIIIIKKQSFYGEEFEPVDLNIFGVSELDTTQNDNLIAPLAMGSKSYQFLFVCIHFSSREKQNKAQMSYLNQLLTAIKTSKIYENVVIGGDLNSFAKQFPEGIDFFPKYQTQITTFKKRTKTQAQIKKSDIRDKRSIDKIITNAKILQGQITLIDGTKPDQYDDDEKPQIPRPEEIQKNKEGMKSKIKMLLPCDVHPFDQFLIKTKIELKVRHLQNDIKLSIN